MRKKTKILTDLKAMELIYSNEIKIKNMRKKFKLIELTDMIMNKKRKILSPLPRRMKFDDFIEFSGKYPNSQISTNLLKKIIRAFDIPKDKSQKLFSSENINFIQFVRLRLSQECYA